MVAGLSCLLLPSCATLHNVSPSRTHYLGSARQIVSCQEKDGHAFVTWRAERTGGLQTTAIDLRTRSVAAVGGVTSKERAVDVIVLGDETSPVPSGASRPCLGIWKVNPGKPASLWMPRVRWVDRRDDWVVNLPGYGIGAHDLATRAGLMPFAVVKDGVMVGTTCLALLGGAAPSPEWWQGWNQRIDDAPSPRSREDPKVDWR